MVCRKLWGSAGDYGKYIAHENEESESCGRESSGEVGRPAHSAQGRRPPCARQGNFCRRSEIDGYVAHSLCALVVWTRKNYPTGCFESCGAAGRGLHADWRRREGNGEA